MSYPTVRLRDVSSPPRYMTHWERAKYTIHLHLFTELVAEMVLFLWHAFLHATHMAVYSSVYFYTFTLVGQSSLRGVYCR